MRRTINKLLRGIGYELSKTSGNTATGIKGPFLKYIKDRQSQPFRLCLDVGANVGHFADEYLAEFSDSDIHCFEPTPQALETLRQKAAKNSHITVNPKAVGKTRGTSTFNLNAKSVTNSLLAASSDSAQWAPASYMAKETSLEVEVITLDDYCAAGNIQHVDLLKIDAQGYDLKVLEGAQRLLQEKRVNWIYIEMLLVPLYEGQCFFHEIHQFLHPLGYNLQSLFGTVFSPQGRMKWTNGLFAPG